MADIKTRAITELKYNPEKLKEFKIWKGRPNGAQTQRDYIKLILNRIETLVHLDEEHEIKFARLIKLTKNTQVDIGYLFEQFIKAYPDCDISVKPVVELYEALIRENWEKLNYEREILDSIDAFNKTPLTNVELCKAIISLLQSKVTMKDQNNENQV